MNSVKGKIMFQGTASNVGKSIIAAGVCRILTQDGYSTVPFKPQNMSLNSYIDRNGCEMGRAQVFQAEACNIEPFAYMNPVLLKPCGNHISQVILNGRVLADMESSQYSLFKEELIPVLSEIFFTLQSLYDVVVVEGAGSPVEINLGSVDISNMAVADAADLPVVLIADIDRGGVFASIVGTLALMKEKHRKRVKGIIINKLRGRKEYFSSGAEQIEKITGIPVIGVIPYTDIKIEEEDGVSEKFIKNSTSYEDDTVCVCVLKLEHMSNYTDFQAFEYIPKVNVRYIYAGEKIDDRCDLLIIPGSKNTIDDLDIITENGMDREIMRYIDERRPLVGICGGYQILGKSISDIGTMDYGNRAFRKGLGVFDMDTEFHDEKKTVQVHGIFGDEDGYFRNMKGLDIKGYELHFGREREEQAKMDRFEYRIRNGHILGTYCHGIFDNIRFTTGLINNIREKKGFEKIMFSEDFTTLKNREYDRLAEHIRKNTDIEKLYGIIFNND